MLYQTFRKFSDGTVARFGRATPYLERAIDRADKHPGGQVRPMGSLAPVWVHHTLTMGQPMQPQRAIWVQPKRVPMQVRIVNPAGSSMQSSDLPEPCPRLSRELSARAKY
jgi:hypothetical protein